MRSIPVVRSQDAAMVGKGVLVGEKYAPRNNDSNLSTEDKVLELHGRDTCFDEQLAPGDQISISACPKTVRVVRVVSPTIVEIQAPFPYPEPAVPLKFTVRKRVSQDDVFAAVHDALGRDRSIAIYPEGGSHDRTELLPLKAGVAIMAIGAVAKTNKPVTIIPVGLNYFGGHMFRSHVLIEFGVGIEVTKERVPLYLESKEGKHKACNALLDEILMGMKGVTLNAPDMDTLNVVHTLRRIYQPTQLVLDVGSYMELNRRFAMAVMKLGDRPQVQEVVQRVRQYNTDLSRFGLKDYQVATLDFITHCTTQRLLWRLVRVSVIALIATPLMILNAPIAILAALGAVREARKSRSHSVVKIQGKDVMASYKILIGIVTVPIVYSIYAVLMGWIYGFRVGVLTLFALPVISFLGVMAIESGLLLWRAIFPMIWSIITIDYADRMKALRADRDDLQVTIRKMVDELGSLVIKDFDKNRLVKKEDVKALEEHEQDLDSRVAVKRYREQSLEQDVDVDVDVEDEIDLFN